MAFQTIIPTNINNNNGSILNLDNSQNTKTQSQIEAQKYNGRVNFLIPSSPTAGFEMQERIAVKNNATSYGEALEGNFENNVLGQVFFSKENIQIVQNGLRAGVYNMSSQKFTVPPQNIDNLKVIMRSYYLQYAKHYIDNITGQIETLNKLVLDYCIPSVYKEAIGYLKYSQDQSMLVVPIERPLNHDRAYKQLELKPFM
jgi:hypothetical protein